MVPWTTNGSQARRERVVILGTLTLSLKLARRKQVFSSAWVPMCQGARVYSLFLGTEICMRTNPKIEIAENFNKEQYMFPKRKAYYTTPRRTPWLHDWGSFTKGLKQFGTLAAKVPPRSYLKAGQAYQAYQKKQYFRAADKLLGAYQGFAYQKRRRTPKYIYINKYPVQPSQRYLRRQRYNYRQRRYWTRYRRKRYKKKRLPYWLWLKNKRSKRRRSSKRYTTSKY